MKISDARELRILANELVEATGAVIRSYYRGSRVDVNETDVDTILTPLEWRQLKKAIAKAYQFMGELSPTDHWEPPYDQEPDDD